LDGNHLGAQPGTQAYAWRDDALYKYTVTLLTLLYSDVIEV